MLDDQNQTIATLKQNLSNKSREYTALQLAVEKLESKLVGTNSEINDLQAELDSQAKLVEHLQSVADEYRDERDDLRVEIVEISRKLKEREKGLDAIEKEVEKMRGVWRAKEEKLLKEKEDAIKAQGFIGVELKERCEVQAIRLAAFEREREAMIQSLQRLQGEVDKAAQEHETELQMLKSEMDRQKQRMSEKMNKLKQAFADP
ncbi:hypothetical protein BC832DRAFT_340687 [Gaertneriomyces semiglobifer]|nr:hypothetical protein BC832DRAFT_340687 [Gaertneriomyces semiglobifer]